MTGTELYPLLFPSGRGATKFATSMSIDLNKLKSKFKANNVDREVLTAFAKYNGYDEEKFIAWAYGKKQTTPFVPTISTIEGDEILANELKKVYNENVVLNKMLANTHLTIADRGTFIIELLDKRLSVTGEHKA